MTILHIDLETIPAQAEWVKQDIADKIEPPKTIKLEASKAKWLEEKGKQAIEDKWLKTSFNGAVGEIICIAWAFDDEPVQVLGRKLDETEKDMLLSFMAKILSDSISVRGNSHTQKNITWCGHYITGFDLRFLWQRMIVNNVKMSVDIPYNVKPWGQGVFDTCHEWKGDTSGYGSLDMAAKILGIEQTKTMDGSQVWPEIQAGNYEKVFDYCKQDVEIARQVYNRIK